MSVYPLPAAPAVPGDCSGLFAPDLWPCISWPWLAQPLHFCRGGYIRQETAWYNVSVLQVIFYRAKFFLALALFFAHCFYFKNMYFYRISPPATLSELGLSTASLPGQRSVWESVDQVNKQRKPKKKDEGPDRTSLMIEMCSLAKSRLHYLRHYAK